MKHAPLATRVGVLLTACSVWLASGAAAEEGRYFGLVLGSVHGGGDLNSLNPGVTYGRKWQLRNPAYEGFVEGGVFYNSYEEVSPILTAGISRRIGSLGSYEVRGGVAVGIARYEELAVDLKANYGISNVNGFIPIALGSLILRGDGRDYRLSLLPADKDIKFVLNLSVAFDF